jgi:hypothetical protein
MLSSSDRTFDFSKSLIGCLGVAVLGRERDLFGLLFLAFSLSFSSFEIDFLKKKKLRRFWRPNSHNSYHKASYMNGSTIIKGIY